MNDFDLALATIGDLELARRKAIMALQEQQVRIEELEAELADSSPEDD